MLFRPLFDHETFTYSYVLADAQTGEAVIIDPVLEQAERDLALIGELGLSLRFILETHVHADHVTGAGVLRTRTGAQTVAASRGAPCADIHVDDGDLVRFGRHALRVIATPGHTDDSMSYLLVAPETPQLAGDRVFTGDALLIRGCGRTDFQNGDPGALFDSITRALFRLPDATLVYPGHDYRGHAVSTIGEEKVHNPRLVGRDRASFIALMNDLHLPEPKRIREAVPANRACGQPAAPAHG